MPLISYAPGPNPGIVMINSDLTIGPTTSLTKTATLPATSGTLPTTGAAAYPMWNIVGRFADAGELADCFNQLVARIEALEAIVGSNPTVYGITPS